MGSVRDAAAAIGFQIDVIPAGNTSKCQILDVGVNKPFAAAVQTLYYEWLRTHPDMAAAKPTRALVARWVKAAWATITPDTIVNTVTHIGFKI